MQIEIITPEKYLFKGEIILVQVPGSKGSFEVLKNHAPIISTLDEGTIKVVSTDDQKSYFEIKGGLIEVKENNIIILAEVS